MPLAQIVFKHESPGMRHKFSKMTIRLDRQKFTLKNGEEKSLSVETGKHKVVFNWKQTPLQVMGEKLKSKIVVDGDEKVGYVCGAKGKEIYYELYSLSNDA
jgi:hypothetical protein